MDVRAGIGLNRGLCCARGGISQEPLERLLTELCGNQGRAAFWTAFSAVTVALVPLIFALGYEPVVEPARPPLLEVASQLKWGLIGMLGSVLMLGWAITRYIPKPQQKPGQVFTRRTYVADVFSSQRNPSVPGIRILHSLGGTAWLVDRVGRL
jgi:hypothetical protein